LSRIGNFGFISVSIFICLIITLVFGLTVCHTVATNLLIGEQKVRQAFQIGKIGEPLFRFFLRIYNYHIKFQIIKLLIMIYMSCILLMHGVLAQRHQTYNERLVITATAGKSHYMLKA
jgi:hypothetical protein